MLNGNCSVGQLTVQGFMQQVDNGKSLWEAYVATGFLSTKFDASEIYLRSDGKNVHIALTSRADRDIKIFPRCR